MHGYLTESFLWGLIAEGVPEGVLYALTRYVANSGERVADVGVGVLKDWLWLSTEWELFGENRASNGTWETVANQARLKYDVGDR
jgi:hypothetical protein